MAYYGNAPADVALVVGQDVITTTEIQDSTIATADIANDAITALKIDDDGTGFQMGSLGLGTAVSGSEKLTVGGTASFSGAITAGSSFTLDNANGSGVIRSQSSANNTVDLTASSGGDAFIEASDTSQIKIGHASSTKLTIDTHANGGEATFSGDVQAGKFKAYTASTTDAVLILGDQGVADYNWTFPDTSTIKMSTNTSSSKVFELKNEGSGLFNLKVEGEIEIQASSDPAIKFNSSEAGADAWYLYSAGSGLKFRNLDDSVTALELTHSNNALLSGSLYMAGGSTGRILFNSQRAMEGTTNNTLLSLGEDYVDVRVRANCIPDGNNTRNLGSTSYRWSVLYTSNSVNVSDRTTKTEIADCDLGTDFINTLQPKSYKMADLPEEHDDYSRKHYGLIAQDLINTDLNDSVFGEQDGEYSLAYNDLIAPMIKAIQELSAEVEKLKGN